MTDRVTLCGATPYHTVKACKECSRRYERARRDSKRSEAELERLRKQRAERAGVDPAPPERLTCPSCQVKFRVNPAPLRDHYNPWPIHPMLFMWIENAARVFDEESEELFTAAEFVAWIRPDVVGINGKREVDPELRLPKDKRRARDNSTMFRNGEAA